MFPVRNFDSGPQFTSQASLHAAGGGKKVLMKGYAVVPRDFDRVATLGQGHCAEHCNGPGFAGLSVPWGLLERQLTAELSA